MQQNKNLKLLIHYALIDDEITILACKGYGTTVTIPVDINGYSVKKIGKYAFSDPEKSLDGFLNSDKIFLRELPGIEVPGSKDEYICGSRLQEISLPESIEILGEYAFYNCKELVTVNMPGGRIQIENGAFMNCDKLTNINIKGSPESLNCARNMLIELTSELCISYDMEEEAAGVFLFPEYYEYSVENTPARILQEELYGAGYRYRQCFNQGRLDILAYDMVFQSAEIQGIHEAALRIAFLRLQYPYMLQESLKQCYLDYITLHIEKAVEQMISQDNIKGLHFLTGLGIMSERNYADAQEEAVRIGRRECAGILLKERLHYYPPKEKKFEL